MSLRSFWPHAALASAVLFGAVICAAIGESAYWFYVGEDRFAETASVVCFAIGFVFAFRARSAHARRRDHLLSTLFLVATVGMFFLVGEEISWGQRLFGWATPEKFREVNIQGETTLHNLDGVHQVVQFAQMAVGFYGVVLPFLVPLLGAGWLRNLLTEIVPPVRYFPYFLPLLGWRILRMFWEIPEENHYAITQINEVLEFVLAIGMAMFFFNADRRARSALRAGPVG